jgi:hypothetical protein
MGNSFSLFIVLFSKNPLFPFLKTSEPLFCKDLLKFSQDCKSTYKYLIDTSSIFKTFLNINGKGYNQVPKGFPD